MEIDELLNKIKILGYYNSLTAYTDEEQAKKKNYNFRVWSLPEENSRLKNTPFFYEGENDFFTFYFFGITLWYIELTAFQAL